MAKRPNKYGLPQAAFTVEQFLSTFPIGRTTFYAEVKAGRIKTVKIGKRTLVMAEDVTTYFDTLRKAS